MHSGVYSKFETPVNFTLTSSPVESLGRTIMESLMFWGVRTGGVAWEAGWHSKPCSPRQSELPELEGSGIGAGIVPHLLEVELQPLRWLPGLGGQDAVTCKAAR